MNWKERIEQWRRKIDNEQEDEIPEIIARAQKNKSESEIFLQKILNAAEEQILNREITRVSNTEKAFVPDTFVVFLSDGDYKMLGTEKRKFFEEGLSKILFERAKDKAGNLKLTADEIKVQIKRNPHLKTDEIEVKSLSKNEKETIDFGSLPPEIEKVDVIGNKNTIEDSGAFPEILYHVKILQNDKKLKEFPIILRRNTVGRDDAGKDEIANLRLPTENLQISRIHAEILLREDGEVWVTSLHKNPTVVSGKTIRNGEQARLGADGEIRIYDFTLKLTF